MRTGISFTLSTSDRQRLRSIIASPVSLQKHVWRARIVLLSGDGLGTSAIMGAIGKSKTCVWRWQERFMHEGGDGLLRDKSRPPGKAPVPPGRVAQIVRLTQEAPPHEATHWTLRAMAKTVGLAASTVQAIWKAHGLSPHRWRQFKLSNDPAFAEKLTQIVGLYVDPPAHAVVLSVDEKSQIQALDRTQPVLPMKKGCAGTMTHDYKRHGTTTLFAALNVLDGTVIGQNMQRHRHQEFIRFLGRIEREVPADKAIHVILDNYAAHKKDKVREWLARHPRWTFHFTPTSCSWLNAVEGFFANPGKRPLNRNEPKPEGDLFAAPEWMSDSQREGWAYAITNAPYGLLKHLDRSMLAIWVVAEDLHREAAEKIAQYGLLTKSPNAGLPLQSPYLAILNKQAQIMIKAGAELGFSPSSRTRVYVAPGIRHNPFNPRPKPWEFGMVHDPDGLLPTPWDPEPQEERDPADKFFDD